MSEPGGMMDREEIAEENFPNELNENMLSIKWRNVTCAVVKRNKLKRKETRKIILKDVSGFCNAGEMMAIIGPSGSGKTTLLNVLSGRNEDGVVLESGKITVNNQHIKKGEMKKLTAYSEQHDALLPWLTVEETLEYAAFLRMPKNVSLKKKLARVQEAIEEMGLEKCKTTQVGDQYQRGVSGGERKRTAIAVEMINKAGCLILDEPTSGLDAKTALNVMGTVGKLARNNNLTVICVIHQPRARIMQLFDKVCIMARGRCVYCGEVSNAIAYFASQGLTCPIHENPADFFIDSIAEPLRLEGESEEEVKEADDRIQKLIASWEQGGEHINLKDVEVTYNPLNVSSSDSEANKESSESSTSSKGRNKKRNIANENRSLHREGTKEELEEYMAVKKKGKLGFFSQLFWLYHRGSTDTRRNKARLMTRVGQSVVIGVLLAIIWSGTDLSQESVNSRLGLLFIVLTNTFFTEITLTLSVFPIELPVFYRERAAGAYQVLPYFLSKNLIEFPYQVTFPPLFFAVVIYFAADLQSVWYKWSIFYTTLTLCSFVASGFGFLLGALFPITIAAAMAPACTVVWLLFSGFLVGTNQIPSWISWVRFCSPFFYAFESLTQNEFTGRTFDCPSSSPSSLCPPPCQFPNGQDVIDFWNLDQIPLIFCLLALFGFSVLFRILAYLTMRFHRIKGL